MFRADYFTRAWPKKMGDTVKNLDEHGGTHWLPPCRLATCERRAAIVVLLLNGMRGGLTTAGQCSRWRSFLVCVSSVVKVHVSVTVRIFRAGGKIFPAPPCQWPRHSSLIILAALSSRMQALKPAMTSRVGDLNALIGRDIMNDFGVRFETRIVCGVEHDSPRFCCPRSVLRPRLS